MVGTSQSVKNLENTVNPKSIISDNSDSIEIFRNKPFWIWEAKQHEALYHSTDGKCCFNHIVGLPEKEHALGRNGKGDLIIESRPHPLYDYQKPVIDSILNYEPTMVVKAGGMGITTLTLRLMCWLCLYNDEYKGDSMGIVTGPRIDIAREELSRIPRIFLEMDYTPEITGNSITINDCTITAYPSHTFDSARGLERVRFFFADESDFFPTGQTVKARHVIERYIPKTHPMIILNSTPNLPGGMFDTLEHENDGLYTIHRLDYKKGLGKIYTEFEIEEAKKSPSFEREYNLQYGIGIGNIFDNNLLDEITENYPIESQGGARVLSIDPAFGNSDTSSKFGYVGFEKRGDIRYVVDAGEISRASPTAMMDFVSSKYREGGYTTLQVDSAFPGLIRDFVSMSLNAHGIIFKDVLTNMTTHASTVVQEKKVRIHPSFHSLISQLKAIEFNDKGHPDKKKLSFDQGDSFLMGLFYWNHKTSARRLKGKF